MKSTNERVSPGGNRARRIHVAIESRKEDLDKAVEIAFLYGASEWVHLNYPVHYQRLLLRYDDSVQAEEQTSPLTWQKSKPESFDRLTSMAQHGEFGQHEAR